MDRWVKPYVEQYALRLGLDALVSGLNVTFDPVVDADIAAGTREEE
jgi:hypothetical protein